jgi:hypothetical protein
MNQTHHCLGQLKFTILCSRNRAHANRAWRVQASSPDCLAYPRDASRKARLSHKEVTPVTSCSRVRLCFCTFPCGWAHGFPSAKLAWGPSCRVFDVGGLWKFLCLLLQADWQKQQFVLGFCLFIHGSSLSDYKPEYYNTQPRHFA